MNKIIISLTSYPARINIVDQVVLSLFKQTERADEIVLWLSTLEFPNTYKDLPECLSNLLGKKGFRIEWVNDNLKSHKKYFYALQDSEDIVITVDDDMIYSNQMVSTLMDSYRKHPYAISARNIHIITKTNEEIAPYLSWVAETNEYIGQERMDLCAIGVNGILYPPKCSNANWFDISSIKKYAENQDDLWLKFNQIVDNIPVVYTGLEGEDRVIEEAPGEPLCFKNAYGGANDVSINELTHILREKHQKLYQDWFDSLMTTEGFWSARREIYCSQLRDIIGSRTGKPVYICGAGKYAHILYDFIGSCGMQGHVTAFLVTERGENVYKDKMILKTIRDLEEGEEFIVLCGVSELYREEMKDALKKCRLYEWVEVDLMGIERVLKWEGGKQ